MSKEGRTTVYNEITSKEKMDKVNLDNIQLENDFIEYLESVDRAAGTIKQYKANLHVFWCWNEEYNKNKFFVDLTKREIAKFQNHAINEWKWSPSRIRTVKATLSSLSNYVENILDDEYEDYRPIINKIESPVNEPVREKTIFKHEELEALLNDLVDQKEYMKACLLAIAMYSGRRKAELTRFKVSYFTNENTICGGSLYKTPEKMTTKGRGKRGKLLYVYTLAKPFKPYFDLWMQERDRLGIDSDWLFPKCIDGQYVDEHIGISTIDSISRTFSNMMNKPFYIHALRHFFTTELSRYGIPDNVIKEIIGWSSLDMVSLYNDTTAEESFDKYFGEDGIKQAETKTLSDL